MWVHWRGPSKVLQIPSSSTPIQKTYLIFWRDEKDETGNGKVVVCGLIRSVAGNSLVSLNPTNQDWTLGYEGVQNFQNIQLIKRTSNGSDIPSTVDTSGEGGGNIKLTALPAIMQYSFLLAPLLSSLSAFRMYLIAAGSAVSL